MTNYTAIHLTELALASLDHAGQGTSAAACQLQFALDLLDAEHVLDEFAVLLLPGQAAG